GPSTQPPSAELPAQSEAPVSAHAIAPEEVDGLVGTERERAARDRLSRPNELLQRHIRVSLQDHPQRRREDVRVLEARRVKLSSWVEAAIVLSGHIDVERIAAGQVSRAGVNPHRDARDHALDWVGLCRRSGDRTIRGVAMGCTLESKPWLSVVP